MNINHGVYIDVFPIDGQPNGFAAFCLAAKKQVIKKAIASHLEKSPLLSRRIIYKLARIIVTVIWHGKSDAALISSLEHDYKKYQYEKYETAISHGGLGKSGAMSSRLLRARDLCTI